MDYHLVKPNYDIGQDYRMNQDAAYANKRANNNNKSELHGKLGTVKHLDHGSLYLHTAHDDEMYWHGLEFPKGTTGTQVRVSIVYRWLSFLAHFRQEESDNMGHRYGMINRSAFDTLRTWETADIWWNAMGYVDDKGQNLITDLIK